MIRELFENEAVLAFASAAVAILTGLAALDVIDASVVEVIVADVALLSGGAVTRTQVSPVNKD